MRIIHLFWSFTIGGAETMLSEIINLQAAQNEVTIIIVNKEYSDELLETLSKKVRIIKINRAPKSKNIFKIIQFNILLYLNNPDIVHCHVSTLQKIIFLKRFKLVLTVHSFQNPINKKNKYDTIISVSKSIEEELKENNLRNVSTIYNGISHNKIVVKQKFNEQIKIACIGRLVHEIKGQHILLRAFSELINSGKDLSLDIIGEGKSKEYLVELSYALNIDRYVNFLGKRTKDEVYSMYQSIDIVVVPSFNEGFGLVAVEAMASKVPLIISDVKGLEEITSNGKYAKVTKSGDYISIANGVSLVYDEIKNRDPKIYNRINEGYQYVKENFSINTITKSYLEVYNNLINN